jgi:filamentous hemagglutinin
LSTDTHDQLGRFLSVDPLLGAPSRPQSWNRYSYVENNPISAVDPSGMKMKCVTSDDGTEECTVVADDPLPDPLPHPSPSPDWVYQLQGALNPAHDAAWEKKAHADLYWRWFWHPPQIKGGTVMLPGLGTAQALIGTSRINLLQNVTNPRLRNLINQMYRPGAQAGTGSTADAIRYEAQTGIMMSRTGHFQKGLEMRTALTRVLREESLSAAERQAVRSVLIDLQKALSGL